jgi:hypothetical protein
MPIDQDLIALIVELQSRWWEPADLEAACNRIRLSPGVSCDEFRRADAMKPVREAWVAAGFAKTRPWDRDWEVWVVPQTAQSPDCKLRQRGHEGPVEIVAERPFEIVQARYPSLADAEERRQFQGLRHEDPDDHFREGLCEAVEQIRKKAGKNYSSRPHLVVYCNFYRGMVLIETALIETVRAKIDAYRNSFPSIWLLWGVPFLSIKL